MYDFNVIMVPIVPETGNFRNDFTENFRNSGGNPIENSKIGRLDDK